MRHRLELFTEPPKGQGSGPGNVEFFLNSRTGVINVEFYKNGTYELDLTAVDKGDEMFLVERHAFNVKEPQKFKIAHTGGRVSVDDNVKVRRTTHSNLRRAAPCAASAHQHHPHVVLCSDARGPARRGAFGRDHAAHH